MTEFLYTPYAKVHVRDVIKLDMDDMVSMISTLESATAFWADGVLFASFAASESEELAKKEMQNETYVDRIMFTKCERFSKTIKSSTNMEIAVINVETSRIVSDMASWLKTQPVWSG